MRVATGLCAQSPTIEAAPNALFACVLSLFAVATIIADLQTIRATARMACEEESS